MAKKEKQKKQYDAKKHIQMTAKRPCDEWRLLSVYHSVLDHLSDSVFVSFRFLIYCRACIDTEWLQYLAV